MSSVKLTELLRDIRRVVPPRRRGALLEALGYIPHPAFPNGQCNQKIMQEELRRPTLYILKDSPSAALMVGAEAFSSYMNAQGYLDAPATPLRVVSAV